MIKIIDQNRFGVVNYVVGTEAEVDDLPIGGLVAQGSTAFVIATSNVYMYDEEKDTWEAI